MAKFVGTVSRLGLEGGVWALMADNGKQYHLIDAPKDLCQDGIRVEVTGEVPAGAGIAMVGEMLKVSGFTRR